MSACVLWLGWTAGCGPEPAKCKEDVECMSGEVCNRGKCEAKPENKCKSNADCSDPTPRCDASSGKCSPECEDNSHCQNAFICASNKCKRDPKIECVTTADCKARQVCDNGVCKDATLIQCKSDGDCATKAYKFCDTAGNCGWECKADSDCAHLQKCDNYRCKDTGECREDGDCALPKGRCDGASRKCVGCLDARDCPAGKICQGQSCIDDPGCSSDNDCVSNAPKCNTSTKKCQECLVDGDCPTGESCDSGVCKAAKGCTPACKTGEYCFNGERCLAEWKSCKEDKECAQGEACVDAGAGKVCLKRCDPTKNTGADDESNAACEGGYGFCLRSDRNDPTLGVCVPPYKKKRAWKESCQNLGNPQKADYHDCQGDLVCVNDGAANFCWKKCDPKKSSQPDKVSSHPDCEGGKGSCHPLSDGGGVCEPVRPKSQKEGEGCLDIDPNKPEWADCGADLVCVEKKCKKATQAAGDECNATDKLCKPGLSCLSFDSATKVALCKANCDPSAPKCAAGFECQGTSLNDPSQGACIDERKKTRKQGESCQGKDPRKPEWNLCENDAPCDASKCGAPRNKSRSKGESCQLADVQDPGFHSCKAGLVCWSNTCLSACDPTASGTCSPTEKCVVLNNNRPKAGVCRTYQGLECDNTPCPTGYFCFTFNFSKRCVNMCNPQAGSAGCPTDHTCQRSDASDPKKGYCILDRLPRRGKGQSCHYSRPEDPAYHGCKAPHVCIGLSCVDKPPATGQEGDACGASKGCQAPLVCTASDAGSDACARPCNPYVSGQCKAGETCVPRQKDKFYWSGGCFATRSKTQALGAACRRSNPGRPDYNDCTGAAVCVGSSGNTFCRDACNPATKPSTCTSGYDCIEYTQGKGACLKTRTKTRKEKETCGSGNESDPSYNDCLTGLVCLTFDSASQLQLCSASCNPSQSNPCAGGAQCVRVDFFDPTKGACIPAKNETRKIGESCGGVDPRNPDWDKCLSGTHCHNNGCVACVQDSHCSGGQVCKLNRCVTQGACAKDADCTSPTPRCDVAAQKCVACLIDGDCPSGQVCQSQQCQTAPGCSSDSSCAVPTPKCNTSTRKCVACLVNGDCPSGQLCQSNVCKSPPPACSPACKTGEYCFNNEKCLPTWKSCAASTDCTSSETCVRLGSRTVCAPNCTPGASTNTCYGGYGTCLALSGSSGKGVCVPPRKKLRDLNQTCFVRDQPEKPEYHDCKTGLECWNGVCLKARTKTQPVDAKCNRTGTGAEHNDCVSGAVCVRGSDGGWCRKSCSTPGSSSGCPTDYDCRALSGQTGGVCVKRFKDTRKVDETCLGSDVNDASYDNCQTGLTCVVFDSARGYNLCARDCNPSNPSCPTDFSCQALSGSSTNGVCRRDRQRLRRSGETCLGADPLKADWHDCVRGFGCVNNTCVTRTQSQNQTCSTQKLCKDGLRCIVFDASSGLNFCLAECNPQQSACPRDTRCVSTSSTSPTRGACIPTRKNTRKHSETCGGNDIAKPDYNDCLSGLICMGTAAHGYHCLNRCNPASPNCATGFRCVRVGVNSGACSQQCTGVSACKYGKTCTDPGSALGFNICL